jgi:hypothetical protein
MSVAASTVIVSPPGGALAGRTNLGDSVTTLEFASTAHDTTRDTVAPRLRRGIVVVSLNEALWRVTTADGGVLGYVERFAEKRGTRFRAKRMIVRQQRFVPVGEFWSMDDALDCFRAS